MQCDAMRILVLHLRRCPPDAPPDEQDTLLPAAAIAEALIELGHEASSIAPFAPDPAGARIADRSECARHRLQSWSKPCWAQGALAPLAPAMLDEIGRALHRRRRGRDGGDRRQAARPSGIMRARRAAHAALVGAAGLARARGRRLIHREIRDGGRLARTRRRFGGHRAAKPLRARAEALRRANSAGAGSPRIYRGPRIQRRGDGTTTASPTRAPIAEMRFEDWPKDRPQHRRLCRQMGRSSRRNITDTVRDFGWDENEPELDRRWAPVESGAGTLFGLRGYARVDFRVDAEGIRWILEINPNPCSRTAIAGFAAAGEQAGFPMTDLIRRYRRRSLHA